MFLQLLSTMNLTQWDKVQHLQEFLKIILRISILSYKFLSIDKKLKVLRILASLLKQKMKKALLI